SIRQSARRAAQPLGRRTTRLRSSSHQSHGCYGESRSMKLAVLGATGGTGRQLIVQAIAAGHTVTALARSHHHKLPAAAGLTVLLGSSGDRSSVVQVVAGQEAVLCALGGRPWRRREEVCSSAMRHILPAMREHGVRRLVAISTFGAGDTRPLVG